MQTSKRIEYIKNWIIQYCSTANNKPSSLIVGVSGGVDSAVTSTICAETGMNTLAISMPIKQNATQHSLSINHQNWLNEKYDNIKTYVIELDKVFESFKKSLQQFNDELAQANSRSRLRMATLYQIAQSNRGLVVGTVNKVEDFGVGFFTKYGDGGVDISPIADCTKTQVWEMARELGILESIINAEPTDGLWEDSRSDEEQLGLSYEQIEEAMKNPESKYFKKYNIIREPNLHKMRPIPICKFDDDEDK